MKNLVLTGLVLLGFSSFLGQALAADGSSGCGPAWYVLKDESLLYAMHNGESGTLSS